MIKQKSEKYAAGGWIAEVINEYFSNECFADDEVASDQNDEPEKFPLIASAKRQMAHVKWAGNLIPYTRLPLQKCHGFQDLRRMGRRR